MEKVNLNEAQNANRFFRHVRQFIDHFENAVQFAQWVQSMEGQATERVASLKTEMASLESNRDNVKKKYEKEREESEEDSRKRRRANDAANRELTKAIEQLQGKKKDLETQVETLGAQIELREATMRNAEKSHTQKMSTMEAAYHKRTEEIKRAAAQL